MNRSLCLAGVAGLGVRPVLLLAFALLFGPGIAKGAGADRPNVLFILIDQYRADLIGAYGGGENIQTPNIDRLAEEGMLFENGISSAPLCTPYRGMLITGRYPTHTGLVLNWVEINPDQRSIAHAFNDAGYRTGFIGKWHLAAGHKKKSGDHAVTEEDWQRIRQSINKYREENPETEYVPPGPQRMGFKHWEAYNFHVAFNNYYFYRDSPERIEKEGYETDIIFDQAMGFMDDAQDNQEPFFLVMAPHPPHPPFRPEWSPPGYLEKVPEKLQWDPNVPEDHPMRENPMQARCYYAMAKNTDDNMGRILDYLDRSGLAEDTVVVFTSDHGTMLGSHGRRNKMVPYREAMKIPLIVRWPGHVPAGKRLSTVYTPMDHFSTLCSLAKVPTPSNLDGRDLSGVLLGRGEVNRQGVLIMNYTSHWDYFDTGTTWPEWRGIRSQRYTYAKWLSGEEELYDNSEDPYQTNNLVEKPEFKDQVNKMRERLQERLKEAHDEFLPGTAYAEWYDDERNLLRTALGPVSEE